MAVVEPQGHDRREATPIPHLGYPLLSFLGESRPSARASYLALVASEEEPPRPRHPLLDGDDSFIALQLERLEPSPEHPRAYLAPPRQPLDELLTSAADADAIAHAYREQGYSMRAIASHLGCGLTTVQRRIRSRERLRVGGTDA